MPNILDAVREEFFSRLQTQTNWGRNQLQVLYTEVERDILSAQLSDDYLKSSAVMVNWKKEKIVQDISKPPTRNRWREIAINDIHPDYDHESRDPFHNDSDINKGL
jgi:hypothetical protein